MVKSTIEIPERENRILNIVKAKFGFKSKEEAFIFLINEYEASLEPEIRPEYLERLEKIRKEGYGKVFTSVDELDRHIKSNA